jgi:general secretion pathway protein A
VLVQFGFSPFKMKKAELIATLNQFLVEQYSAGRKVLLIVDEAQNLSLKVLEEVRMLSGVETTKEKVLRIILAGQPELNHKLDAPELVQLTQRVRLRFHLGTLSAAEMQAYIHHRLEVAGAGDRQIFAEDTYAQIYRYTGGVPRLVNTLCDTAMLAAYGQDRDHVLLEDLNTSVQELRWHEYEARPTLQERAASVAANDGLAATHRAGRDNIHNDPLIDTQNQGDSAEPVGRVILATEGRITQELPLRVGRVIIGRTSDNDVQVDSRFVSRHHCQIVTGAEGSMIEDLNSTNGIFVQGKRVRRYNLNDGDVVVIGKHEIMYVDERLARARTGSTAGAAGVPILDKALEESEVEAAIENPASGRAVNRS